jgi:hypothetical protein
VASLGKWSVVIKRATSRSLVELARVCDVHATTIGRALKDNRFHPEDLRELWQAFETEIRKYLRLVAPSCSFESLDTFAAIEQAGFEIKENKHVDQRRKFTRTNSERRQSSGKTSSEIGAVPELPADFLSALALIDGRYQQLNKEFEWLALQTGELIKYLRSEHYLISSMVGPFSIFDTDTERGRRQRELRFSALANGFLWAWITPTNEYLTQIQRDYGIDFSGDYQSLVSHYRELREEYGKRFSKGQKPAKEVSGIRTGVKATNVDLCMQRLECDEFLFTPPHRVTSLLGYRPEKGQVIARVITRSPIDEIYSYQVLPVGNGWLESHVRSCFRKVIDDYAASPNKNRHQLEGSPLDRQQFCRNLLRRMEG